MRLQAERLPGPVLTPHEHGHIRPAVRMVGAYNCRLLPLQLQAHNWLQTRTLPVSDEILTGFAVSPGISLAGGIDGARPELTKRVPRTPQHRSPQSRSSWQTACKRLTSIHA